MEQKQFEYLVKRQLDHCYAVLTKKGEEYKGGYDDRLSSFWRAAVLQGCTKKRALSGMLAKHVVSIYDMCKDDKHYEREIWVEKITDTVNYLLLLYALIQEEQEKGDVNE